MRLRICIGAATISGYNSSVGRNCSIPTAAYSSADLGMGACRLVFCGYKSSDTYTCRSTYSQYTYGWACKVPIRRDGARKGHPIASVSAVCACPQGGTAKLRLERKTCVKPGTITHTPVNSTYTGHGFVTGRPLLYHNHAMQVAQGPAIMVKGETITVQVMHLGATPLRLTTDMTVGYIDPYEGPSYEVPPDELQERDGTSKEEEESPRPGVDVSSVPDEWSGALTALLKKHAPLWRGNLRLIRGVEHRIRLKPGAVPVRQHPYRAGPLAR